MTQQIRIDSIQKKKKWKKALGKALLLLYKINHTENFYHPDHSNSRRIGLRKIPCRVGKYCIKKRNIHLQIQ
jgi:hypothetical protein